MNTPRNDLARLSGIGFKEFGRVELGERRRVFYVPLENREPKNILYAIVDEGVVLYIGQTKRGIRRRFQAYTGPSARNRDLRLQELMRKHLEQHKSLRVYGLPVSDLEKSMVGEFEVNMVAGLEPNLIVSLKPPWN